MRIFCSSYFEFVFQVYKYFINGGISKFDYNEF